MPKSRLSQSLIRIISAAALNRGSISDHFHRNGTAVFFGSSGSISPRSFQNGIRLDVSASLLSVSNRSAIFIVVWAFLSFRDVEDLLAERGLDFSYETVRLRAEKGQTRGGAIAVPFGHAGLERSNMTVPSDSCTRPIGDGGYPRSLTCPG